MTLEYPLKVYTDDEYRKIFLKLKKKNHYHIEKAQEVIDEVTKEDKGIIIK